MVVIFLDGRNFALVGDGVAVFLAGDVRIVAFRVPSRDLLRRRGKSTEISNFPRRSRLEIQNFSMPQSIRPVPATLSNSVQGRK